MDAEAFARLVAETGDKAYNFAWRLAGNEADARDLVAEAYARALRGMGRYDPSRPFGAWLLTILRHVYLDALRRPDHGRTLSLDAPRGDDAPAWTDALAAPDAPLDRELDRAETADLLGTALARLAPHYRAAVTLCDVEGLSYEEAAEVMDVPVGTVRSRVHQGRVKLREAYEAAERAARRGS